MIKCRVRRCFPDDVQNDVFVVWIRCVAMAAPATDLQIDFDVADPSRLVVELNDGVPKIRARFFVPKSGMNHMDVTVIKRVQVVAANALVKPDLLQKALRRDFPARITQTRSGVGALSPLFVKVRVEQGHLPMMPNDALAKSRI